MINLAAIYSANDEEVADAVGVADIGTSKIHGSRVNTIILITNDYYQVNIHMIPIEAQHAYSILSVPLRLCSPLSDCLVMDAVVK